MITQIETTESKRNFAVVEDSTHIVAIVTLTLESWIQEHGSYETTRIPLTLSETLPKAQYQVPLLAYM